MSRRKFAATCLCMCIVAMGFPFCAVRAEAHQEVRTLQRLQQEIDGLRRRLDEADAQRREDGRKIQELQDEIDRLRLRTEAPLPAPAPVEIPGLAITSETQSVVLAASVPLTGEGWTAFAEGEVVAVRASVEECAFLRTRLA